MSFTASLLAKCRYTLQYTYPYAYYMDVGSRKELFEYQQVKLIKELFKIVFPTILLLLGSTRGWNWESVVEGWTRRDHRPWRFGESDGRRWEKTYDTTERLLPDSRGPDICVLIVFSNDSVVLKLRIIIRNYQLSISFPHNKKNKLLLKINVECDTNVFFCLIFKIKSHKLSI